METTEVVNEELKNLYSEKWQALSDQLGKYNLVKDDKLKAGHPLLLKLGEHFNFDFSNRGSKKIVMCFGQEANDKGGIFSGKMDNYETLINQVNCDKNSFDSNSHRSCGVIAYRWIKSNAQALFGLNENDVFVIWNNIRKIPTVNPTTKGKIDNELREITEKYFKVIPRELEIIKPDLLFFCTAPSNDADIKLFVGEMENSQVCRFNVNTKKGIVKDRGELLSFSVNGFKSVRGYYPRLTNSHWKNQQEKIINNKLFLA